MKGRFKAGKRRANGEGRRLNCLCRAISTAFRCRGNVHNKNYIISAQRHSRPTERAFAIAGVLPSVRLSDSVCRRGGPVNKKAKLSQRWPREAPILYGCPENFRESLSPCMTMPTAIFPEIFTGLLFRSILWMCVQNLKFVALPILEIIRGTQNIWAVPVYAHAPISSKI